jgi:hypothetical protein
MKSQACTESSRNHRLLIGGPQAQVITGVEQRPLMRPGSQVASKAESVDISGKPLRSQSRDLACAEKSNPVCAAHAEFVSILAGHPPRLIPLQADALDFEDRADHLNTVLSALSVYVTVILDDTAQNVPGSLDLRDAEAVLTDLRSDVTGAIQYAADGMAGRVA